MNNEINNAYNVLTRIYNGEYLQQALMNYNVEPLATKIVYGVLDNDVRLDYYVSCLTSAKPDRKTALVVKIGIYLIDYIDSMPNYAAVSECVDLVESIGKKQLKPFVNATLKRYISRKIELPTNKYERMSVEYSKPLWLVKAYCKQYGEDTAINLMTSKSTTYEHARANTRKITTMELEEVLKSRKMDFAKSDLGFFIRNDRAARDLFDLGLITYQSLSSMWAVKALSLKSGDNALDLCAAPGGKAVYISELAKSGSVIAADLHPHRVELIKSYAARLGANNLETAINDALVLNQDWFVKFDCVLCDVPCSGLGVVNKKPDILLNKSMADIEELSVIQYNIINNAIEYLKVGGALVYSTCTTLREENYNVIGKTLKLRDDVRLDTMDIPYANEGWAQIMPSGTTDGFFIARLIKIK